jgi:hypothetical protein
MILEPLLYGRSVGVFPVPLLMMIAFWTWLWGGIGLLLATPMTVCLVVFARHVPQLDSVRVLLSDEPAMETKITYYQRLLAMDRSEATDILRRYLMVHSREQAYDEVLLPALSYAKADLRRNKITAREHQYVMKASREILETVATAKVAADWESASEGGSGTSASGRISIVSCPAQDEADEIALLMLRQLLNPLRYQVETISSGTLTSEIAAVVAEKNPALVCIAAVAPGGLTQVRYICKRLRALSADVKIVAGRWGYTGEIGSIRESLIAAGADQVGGTLWQTRDQISNLRPFISHIEASAQSSAPRRAATSS